MSDEVLNYVDLVARYEAGLIENLRSFGLQAEWLDLWVPDEDLSRSLLNLFDAATEVGRRSLAVRIPADAIAGLKRAGLLDQAAERGRLSIEPDGGSAVLRISDLHVVATPARAARAAPSPQPPPAARAASGSDVAEQALRQPMTLSEPYAAPLAAADKTVAAAPLAGLVRAQAEIDGLVLDADINPRDHVIHAMTASGARGKLANDLAAAMAGLCKGLPILEAADHGAIRLEYLLRGDAARPRAGIVIPEAIEPAFRFMTALLRALLADYRRKAGFQETANTFDVHPGPLWSQADGATRRTMLADAFAAGGFPITDINIVAIEYDVRVVVSLDGKLAARQASLVAALERCIKKHVDGRLELYLTEVKDSNKLRRLSEQKSKTL